MIKGLFINFYLSKTVPLLRVYCKINDFKHIYKNNGCYLLHNTPEIIILHLLINENYEVLGFQIILNFHCTK